MATNHAFNAFLTRPSRSPKRSRRQSKRAKGMQKSHEMKSNWLLMRQGEREAGRGARNCLLLWHFVVRCKPGLQAYCFSASASVSLLSCQAGCRKHLPDELLMLLIVPVDNYTRKGGKGRVRERLGECLRGAVAWLVTRSLANFIVRLNEGDPFCSQHEWEAAQSLQFHKDNIHRSALSQLKTC